MTSLSNSPPISPKNSAFGKENSTTIVCLMEAEGEHFHWNNLSYVTIFFVGPTELTCPDLQGTFQTEALLRKEGKYDRLSSYSKRSWQWLT